MITEDYVSFETAKLLKAKSADFDTDNVYTSMGRRWEVNMKKFNYAEYDVSGYVKRPTLQMVMKWLREVHKLHIAILWDCGAYIGKNSFCYHIDRIDNYEDKGYNKIGFDSYEEAVEAAIKYCLENLIGDEN